MADDHDDPNDPDFAVAVEDVDIVEEEQSQNYVADTVNVHSSPNSKQQDEQDGLHVDVAINDGMVKDYYLQKYKQEWELNPAFQSWLRPVPDDIYKAECVICNTTLRCHKLKLLQHANSKKHQMSLSIGSRERSRSSRASVALPRAQRRSFGRRVSSSRGRGRALYYVKHESDEPPPIEQQDVSYSDTTRVTYSIGLGGSKVGFIGAGVLAQAVGRAILDKGVIHSGRVTVSAPSNKHLAIWSSWGTTVTNCNDVVLRSCDVVLLAVPAHAAEQVLHDLAAIPQGGEKCFISLVPGLSRHVIELILASKLGVAVPASDQLPLIGALYVVRCMVNLAVRTGAGCCAYSIPASLPSRWLLCLEVLCGSLGASQQLPDSQLDAFAATFGAGTAFTLVFAEALVLAAASVGLPWEVARKMAAQTLMGTGQLMLDENRGSTLHEESAPSGGATVAGLVALQQISFKSSVAGAVEVCLKKLREPSV